MTGINIYKKYIGEICVLEYEDASYSYADILEDKIQMPKSIVSVGKIRRVNKDLIDLGVIWSDKNKYFKGIIIPLNAVIKVMKLRSKN